MKKRSAITAVIIMFICVAVYLNWNAMPIKDDGERISENLGGTKVVVNDEGETTAADSKKAGEKGDGSDKEENKSKDIGEYFDEARLEKQRARDAAITTLREAVAEEGVSRDVKNKAAASIETISTNGLAETNIETLVKAKGYEECVALINDSGVSVIVSAPEEGLTSADTTKIKDIVVGETNVSPTGIKIVEIN